MSIPPALAETPRRWFAPSRRQSILLVTGIVILGGLGAIWGSQSHSPTDIPGELQRAPAGSSGPARLMVDIIRPTPGGLPRQVVQTGSVEAFESAGLYARVSGNLKSIDVEIGDIVREGQTLAVLDAPELVEDKNRHSALLKQAESQVLQFRARLATAKAERLSAEGVIQQSEARVDRAEAECSFRGKELARIQKLAEKNAVETKLVDEKFHQWEAAKASKEEAKAQAAIAKAELATIDSRIEQAEADVNKAEADVEVAKAECARAEVMLGFTRITAPFAGVVTRRNFDRGSFIRAATDGAGQPLLELARTDRMRVVLRIPDPDVPYVHPGQTARVRIDVLGDRVFSGTLARVARTQDSRTRTMRAEIDLANPTGELVGGMYGDVTIEIPASATNLSLPEECLAGPALNGRGKVYVLSAGRLDLREVGLGRIDNGRIEVVSCLSAEDRVVASLPAGAEENLEGRPAAMVRSK